MKKKIKIKRKKNDDIVKKQEKRPNLRSSAEKEQKNKVLKRIKKKINKKRNKFIRKIFKSLAIFVVAVSLLVALAFTNLFILRSVEISGLSRYQNEDVIAKSGLNVGQNWYKMLGLSPMDWLTFKNTAAEKRTLDAFPYISNVAVRFVPPKTARIIINERMPVYVVDNAGTYVVLSSEGLCLEIVPEERRPTVLPLIINSGIQEPIPGKKIQFNEPYIMENLSKLFELIRSTDVNSEKKLERYVSTVDFSKIDAATITLDERIKVNLGDLAQLTSYKLSFLKEVFLNSIKENEKGSLDFSRDDTPVFNPE